VIEWHLRFAEDVFLVIIVYVWNLCFMYVDCDVVFVSSCKFSVQRSMEPTCLPVCSLLCMLVNLARPTAKSKIQWAIYSASVSYFKIYQNDLHQIFRVGATVAVDDHLKLVF